MYQSDLSQCTIYIMYGLSATCGLVN